MKNYLQKLDSVVGARRTGVRAVEVLGVSSPSTAMVPAKQSTVGGFLNGVRAYESADVPDGVATILGSVVGLAVGMRSKHPYLGVLAGGSLGRNLPALFSPYKRVATRNLLTTGGGVTGSLLWKGHPVLGYVVGLVAGGTAAYVSGAR